MCELANTGMLMFLAIAAKKDVQTKEITIGYLCVGIVFVLFYQIIWGKPSLLAFIAGIITGLFFLCLSKWTEEGIGYGDSLMILIIGAFLGVWKLMVVLMVAFVSVSLVSGIGLKMGKLTRKSTVPFYPYLLFGYVGALLCG